MTEEMKIIEMWLNSPYDGHIRKILEKLEKKAAKTMQELKTKGTTRYTVPYEINNDNIRS